MGRGETVLPFDVGLPQAIVEAIAASGERGLSSEELAATFHTTSKLLAMLLRSLTAQFKVRSSRGSLPRQNVGVRYRLSSAKSLPIAARSCTRAFRHEIVSLPGQAHFAHVYASQ